MSDEQKNTSNSPVTVTPRAVEQLTGLMRDMGRCEQKSVLRLFVQGGGCSGFIYGMQLEDEAMEDDWIFESNGVKIVIDPISRRYLTGVEIDFTENPNDQGGGFSIKNPTAKSTCGCGQSFNTE